MKHGIPGTDSTSSLQTSSNSTRREQFLRKHNAWIEPQSPSSRQQEPKQYEVTAAPKSDPVQKVQTGLVSDKPLTEPQTTQSITTGGQNQQNTSKKDRDLLAYQYDSLVGLGVVPSVEQTAAKQMQESEQNSMQLAAQAERQNYSDEELFSAYAQPDVKLSDYQLDTAKELVKGFEAKYPKAQSFDPINGTDQESAYQYAAMMNDPQYQEYLQLKNKVDGFSSFTTGLTEGTGIPELIHFAGFTLGDDEDKAAMDAWRDDRNTVSAAGSVQNPIAYGAGYLGGKMAEYAVGRDALKAIPGVGNALQRFGGAVNTALNSGTKAGTVLSTLFPADRIAGIASDQILDLLLDTTPQVAEDIMRMNRQQREGVAEGEEKLTPFVIGGRALGNFSTNLGYNLLGEVPGMIGDARKNLPDALKAQDALDALDEGITPTAQQVEAYNRYAARNGLEGSEDWYDVNMSQRRNLFSAQEPEEVISSKMEIPGQSTRNNPNQIDGTLKTEYNGTNGGVLNESAGETAVSGMVEDPQPVGQGVGAGNGGKGQTAGGNQVLRGFLTPDENLNQAVARTGATPLELTDTTGDPQLFSSALEQARQTNPHGLMVSGKSVEELTQPGTVTFMSRDGLAGALVTADGDIEAVFKNPQSSAKGAASSLLLNAINNGGTKLDCYGDDLVNMYNRYGFEPVARVKWNPEYAPEGWTYGPKDVYVMKLTDGVGINEINARIGLSETDGGFHRWTQEELNALPVMDYDEALAYRDSLIKNSPAQTSADAIPTRVDGSASVSAPVRSNTPPAAPASGTNNPQIPDGMKERGYAESLRTKSNLPDDVKQDFVDNPEVYKQLSNADTFARAEAIFAEGSETAMNQFNRMLETKDAAAIPLGKMLADDLIANGNREAGVDVLRRMAASLTASGQFSQAAAITLLKNDPMTALQYITRQIDSLNANGLEKFGKKWKDFSLTKEEIDAFGNLVPGDSDGLKKLFEQIGDRVAKEYPASVKEKLVEATHIAMLLNPRTMIRNLSSNLIFRPLEKVSNKVSALGQKMYSLINSDFTPTQALFIDKESRNLASQVYDSVKEKITGADKWENSILSGTKEKTVFKGNAVNRNLGDFGNKLRDALNKASTKITGEELFDAIDGEKSILENLRQLTYGLLELGDRGFVKSNFTDRLASYIAAQGIRSIDDVPPEAIDTAMNAALKATFKDQNNLTNLFSAIRKNMGVLGETVFPFTTTPANVTMRSWDYTLGGAVNAIRAAKSGKEAGEIFDLLSKSVTGTAAVALGAGLYHAGVLSGPASENKREAQFQKQQGFLPFALKIGDNYYSISWAAPASIPIVIGATLASESQKDGDLDADSILKLTKNAFASYIDTMLEQSTFQNLQDLFSTYGSTGENVIDTVAELPLRFIPSASGAAARALDPVQRVTYSSDSILDTLYNNALAKIPGASKTLPAAYDTWGNEIRKSDSIGEAAFAQFINPGEIGNKAVTPLDSYIQTLFDETGDTALYPKKVDWSITVNDGSGPEDLKLTNDQYSAYQREVGSTSYDIAEQLFPMLQDAALPTSSQTYAVKEVYSIADELAKNTLFGDTISTADQNFLDKAESYGEGAQGIAELLFAKAVMHDVEGEKYPNGDTIRGSVKRNKIQALVDAGYSRSEATKIYELLN